MTYNYIFFLTQNKTIYLIRNLHMQVFIAVIACANPWLKWMITILWKLNEFPQIWFIVSKKTTVKCAYEFPFIDGATYFTEVLSAALSIGSLSYPGTGQEVSLAVAGSRGYSYRHPFTHFPLDKMAAISQIIFSVAFSLVKNFDILQESHWSLFLGIQLTITQEWFG